MCWLKSQVTPRSRTLLRLRREGRRRAGAESGPIEFSIDRTGGDYRNMDVTSDPTGSDCEEACKGEDRCRAWTYVRPGYLGARRAAF